MKAARQLRNRGEHLSFGYAYHWKHDVELYLTESFTFRVLEPAAAVRLVR